MEDERETTSLRHRRRKGTMSLSCCFQGHSRRFESYDSSLSSPDVDKSSPVLRSPSSWFRSKPEFPDTKGRCRNLISRMGRPARRHSADFSYDPLSYALNFDDGLSENAHLEDFSARLPMSPPRRRASAPRLKNLELPESAARKGIESPTAAERTTVERPPPVSREISVE
ncbi:hypothetical protein HYC85_027399 [Camellia sinensis]|uniref:Uncharacterized protein n=1 Tax=Camellia sinensis TaxID=4442 RepID=A0A7J7G6A7_CAMSI|nr:hypothetical protein HYC85_027399 [Camellia sinensis]